MKQEFKKELSILYNYFVLKNGIVTFFIFTMTLKALIFNYLMSGDIPVVLLSKGALGNVFVIILILYLPLFYLKKSKNFVSFTLTIIFTLILIVDLIYFRYFSSFPPIAQLGIFMQTFKVVPAAATKFLILDLLFFFDVVAGGFFLAWQRKQKIQISKLDNKQMNIFKIVVIVLSTIYLLYLYGTTYGTKVTSNFYSGRTESLRVGYLGTHLVETYKYLSDGFNIPTDKENKETIAWLKNNSIKQLGNSYTGMAKDKNIILVQVESLTNAAIGKKVEGQEITPNLNKLIGSSTYFPNHYTQVSGGGTSDADFSTNTSIYPLREEPAFVFYGNDNFSSLPKSLNSSKYHTYSYHGYDGDYWNRRVAYTSLGFGKSYFGEDYQKGDSVMNMGMKDGDFFKQTIDKMAIQKKPYFSYIITLSSHAPYNIEDKDKLLKIREDKYLEEEYGYFQNLSYTDNAIGELINNLKKTNQYEDSLIVVYGDHRPAIDKLSFDDGILNRNSPELESVPLIVKLPGQVATKVDNSASSHLDIMPTILNLVGIKTDSLMFGRDLFGQEKPYFEAMYYTKDRNYYSRDLRMTISDNEEKNCSKQNGPKYQNTILSDCNIIDINKSKKLNNKTENLIKYNLFDLR